VARRKNQDVLDRAVDYFEDCQDHHAEFTRGVKRRSDAYHALKDIRADASYGGWRNAHFAPYVMHIVDSTLASMVEDKLRFKIRARPTLQDLNDPVYQERAREGERAHQILHDHQIRTSKFTRIQRPFLLQQAIAQVTVAKTTWVEKIERRRRMVVHDEVLTNDEGDAIVDPFTFEPQTHPVMQEETKAITVYDGPMTDVVDVYDFFWPKNALSLESANYVAHRVWLTKEELEEQFEDGGMYGPDKGGWTKKAVMDLVGDRGEGSQTDGVRWSGKHEPNHSWHKLEIVELWDMRRKEVVTFVNRCALLAYKDKLPYFHEGTPFVVCTTQPDLFSFTGISQVEKVMALQELLWKITNQSVDNLELINNAIVIFNPALENAASLPFYPGAAWAVEDPDLVQMWSPNPIPAEISLNREGLIKGDMQNLAATFPFSSGAESQTVDQKTATGASIVSNLAQRSIDMAKQPVYDAWEDIGQQRTILNGQFIREATIVDVIGTGGDISYEEILPEILAGDFDYISEPIPDALSKQQESAKATAMMQIFSQMAPILLPLAQAGQGRMINFDKVIEFFLKANDIEDTEQFFVAKGEQANAQLPQQGSPAPPGSDSMGITGEGSIAPENSPSAMISQSPETALQRAQALSGGGQSV
jgi:hypothetical protein